MLNRLKTCISCGTQALMADAPHCEACWSTEWRFRCTLHDVECVGTACPQCSYVFDGKPYSNSVSLAEAFTRNWSHAAAALRASPCSAWVRASLSDEHTARLIQDIEIERLLSDDELVSLVSWTLDSSRGITWRGTNVSHRKAALGLRDWLDLLESTVPKHCAGSPPMVWLADLADDWSLARRNCRDHAPAMFATTPRLRLLAGFLSDTAYAKGLDQALQMLAGAVVMRTAVMAKAAPLRLQRMRDDLPELPKPKPKLDSSSMVDRVWHWLTHQTDLPIHGHSQPRTGAVQKGTTSVEDTDMDHRLLTFPTDRPTNDRLVPNPVSAPKVDDSGVGGRPFTPLAGRPTHEHLVPGPGSAPEAESAGDETRRGSRRWIVGRIVGSLLRVLNSVREYFFFRWRR